MLLIAFIHFKYFIFSISVILYNIDANTDEQNKKKM